MHGRVTVGHPVDVASGAVTTSRTDAIVSGRFPIDWSPGYSTANLHAPPSAFGPGWHVPFSASLVRTDFGWRFRAADGQEIPFDADETGRLVSGRLINFGQFAELRASGAYEFEVITWKPEAGTVSRYRFPAGPEGKEVGALSLDDNAGNALDFDHDDRGWLQEIRQRRERRSLAILYNRSGLIEAIELCLPSGRRRRLAEYHYLEGRLAQTSNAGEYTFSYRYDSAGRLVAEVTPTDFEMTFCYDGAGRCIETVGTGGMGLRRLCYFGFGLTVVTNARGKEWLYACNAAGQLTSLTSPVGHTQTNDYDEFGRLSVTSNANGSAWAIGYDEFGNVSSLTDPAGAVTTFRWDRERRLRDRTDALGARTELEYDAMGRTTAIRDAVGLTDRFIYDERGDLTRASLADGRTGDITTDEFGYPQEISFAGARRRYVHDDEGRLLARTDQDGANLCFTYDTLGRLASVRYPSGDTYHFAFGYDGRLLSEHGPCGLQRRYDYTLCGNLIERTDSEGRTYRYEWGREPGQLRAIINPAGERFEFRYDDAGRISSERGFDGRAITMERDPAGRVTAYFDAANRRETLERDELGRVIARATADDEASFAYDAAGRLTSARNRTCEVAFSYDFAGRLLREQCGDHVIANEYVGWRRVGRAASIGPDVRYEYSSGALSNISCGPSAALHICRGPLNGIEAITRSNRADEAFSIDETEACVRRSTYSANRLEHESTSSFGTAGLIDRISSSRGGIATFHYDSVGRLIQAQHPEGAVRCEQFEFDAMDNIVRRTTRSGSELCRYEAGNRLIAAQGEGGTTRAFSYDESGRLVHEVSANGRINEFGQSGNLIASKSERGGTVAFAYDAMGRRVRKVSDECETEYLWDGATLAGEVRTDRRTGRACTLSYVHDPDGFTPLLRTVDGRPEFFHFDHLGTPMALTGASGVEVWRASYTAFGEADVELCDTEPNHLRLPGQYFDEETGYHYNRHRYYDPRYGRYISPDPICLFGGANTYAYTPTPTMFTDPLGLSGGDDNGLVDGLRQQAEQARGPATQPNDNVGAAAVHDPTGARGVGANSNSPQEGGQSAPNGSRPPFSSSSEYGGLFDPRIDPRVPEMVTFRTHAEAAAFARMVTDAGGRISGGTVTMYSTKAPCPICQAALQELANRTKTTITVHHPDGEPMEFKCQTCQGG